MKTETYDSNSERKTMSTGEAAQRLGLRVPQIRRRMDWGDLEGTWASPSPNERRDVNGHILRGHRRIYVDSVESYERRMRAQSEQASRNS